MPNPIRTLTRLPPTVTSQEMRRLDNWAEREYQMPLLVMAEHAGRVLAHLLVRRFRPKPDTPILVLAGKGGNGAGALAAARHLRHGGFSVAALTTDPQTKLRDETKRHLSMFRRTGGSCPPFGPGGLPPAEYILDGILGYGLTDTPKGMAQKMIQAANASGAPILALDLPSGLHPDTGTPSADTIRAAATLTIALPKAGLLESAARAHVGELYLADITFPRPVYEEYGTTPEELFGGDEVVRLPLADSAQPRIEAKA